MDKKETVYLEHHGILGQKWGVRRYRNKDGTLTPAGKKREAKLRSELELLKKSKTETTSSQKSSSTSSEQKEAPKQKTISDLDDQELSKVVTRMNLENRYNELSKNLNDPNRNLRIAKEKLELQRDYNKLYKELNPPKENVFNKYLKQVGNSLVNEVSSVVAKEGKEFATQLIQKMTNKDTDDK